MPDIVPGRTLSYFLHSFIGTSFEQNSEWLKESVINSDLSIRSLLKHLVMAGTPQGSSLNNVVWSLAQEMRISIIFPLLLWSIVRHGWRALLFWGVFSLACAGYFFFRTSDYLSGYREETLLYTWTATGYFIIFFAGGAYLAVHRNFIADKIDLLTPVWKFSLLGASLICLLVAHTDKASFKFNIVDYLNGMGALGIISLAIGWKGFSGALNYKFPVWLGRISYSLYLVHLPVLYVTYSLIGTCWPFFWTALVTFMLSLLIAELIATLIEFPVADFGRKFAHSKQPKAIKPAVSK